MSKVVRTISIVWLLICISLAILGISQSRGGNPEGGIAPAILIIFLTAPLGIVVQLLLASLGSVFQGLSVYITSEFLVYPAIIGVGYWQWFFMLPNAYTKMKNAKSPKVWGLAFVAAVAILYGVYRFYIHAFPNSL